MAGGSNGLADAGNAGPGDVGGDSEDRDTVGLRGVVTCEMELALEIGLGHFEISHRHADVVVSQ